MQPEDVISPHSSAPIQIICSDGTITVPKENLIIFKTIWDQLDDTKSDHVPTAITMADATWLFQTWPPLHKLLDIKRFTPNVNDTSAQLTTDDIPPEIIKALWKSTYTWCKTIMNLANQFGCAELAVVFVKIIAESIKHNPEDALKILYGSPTATTVGQLLEKSSMNRANVASV